MALSYIGLEARHTVEELHKRNSTHLQKSSAQVSSSNYLQEEIEREIIYQMYTRRVLKSEKAAIAAATIITLVGTVCVLGRLYIRSIILRNFYIDDWFIVASLFLGLLSFASWLMVTVPDMYIHEWWVSWTPPRPRQQPAIFDTHLKISNAGVGMWIATSSLQGTFGRLSVLYTFARLCVAHNRATRNVRRVIHVAAALTVILSIPFVWVGIDPCWPPTGGFSFSHFDFPKSKCYTMGKSNGFIPIQVVVFFFQAVFTATADLFAFSLPFVVFRWAAVPQTQRRGLYALFGFAVLMFSIFRAVNARELQSRWLRDGFEMSDLIRTQFLFGIGEANGVMVGAALPVIAKPLWRKAKGAVEKWKEKRGAVQLPSAEQDSASNQPIDTESGTNEVKPDTPKQERRSIERRTYI